MLAAEFDEAIVVPLNVRVIRVRVVLLMTAVTACTSLLVALTNGRVVGGVGQHVLF